LSRIVHAESPARERRRLLQLLALAADTLDNPSLPSDEARDLLSFMLMILAEIRRSARVTSQAWEKRGYWLKADAFIHDWSWVETCSGEIEKALQQNSSRWTKKLRDILAEHLGDVNIPKRILESKPWEGAWLRWRNQTASDPAA
jgi:hypothetical protein